MKTTRENLLNKGIVKGKLMDMVEWSKENPKVSDVHREYGIYLNEKNPDGFDPLDYDEIYPKMFLLLRGGDHQKSIFYIKSLDNLIERKVYFEKNRKFIIISGLEININY